MAIRGAISSSGESRDAVREYLNVVGVVLTYRRLPLRIPTRVFLIMWSLSLSYQVKEVTTELRQYSIKCCVVEYTVVCRM
jgi:hypothetical protein